MSKQQTIRQIEGNILKPETYLFKDHLERLAVMIALTQKEVPKDHEIIRTLTILINETCRTAKESKQGLHQRYAKKLKMLTILGCFYGCTTSTLSHLMRQLNCSRQQTLNLLLQASISKLITVQIDEPTGKVKITQAKIRQRDIGEGVTKYVNGKLIQIKEHNAKLDTELRKIVENIGGESKVKQEIQPKRIGIGRIH